MTISGKTIHIFFDDKLGGIQTVCLDDWVGEIYIGERKHLKYLGLIPDLEIRAGFYFLLSGESQTDSEKKLYIGKSVDFINRMYKHNRDKKWWNTFVIFSTTVGKLTGSHVEHLEKAFHKLAKENLTTISVDNNSKPGKTVLTPSDKAYMNSFMDKTVFVLKALRIVDFTVTQESIKSEKIEETFYINVGKNYTAKIQKTEEDRYILLKDSHIKANPAQSFNKSNYSKIREKLIQENLIVLQEDKSVMNAVKDIYFDSSSAVASVVLGRAANGKIVLKTDKNILLRDFEIEKELECLQFKG